MPLPLLYTREMSVRIQFLGGAGTVTGSKFLVDTGSHRILVDCGLFQGIKELRLLNRAPFPIDPAKIDAVVLTHAHLDHSGYLPLLAKNGFHGKIHCTSPTKDLARLILLDSAHIQEEDADYANQKGFSKHKPALPLYDTRDVQALDRRWVTASPGSWKDACPGIHYRFTPSGHILGAAFVEIDAGGKLFVFSGDVGRAAPILYDPPSKLERADVLVIESTYGDRSHPKSSTLEDLERVVNETCARGGHLVIASFAVGRTQEILHLLSKLRRKHRIPEIPVFLDSPMGISATDVFFDHANWHRLDKREVEEMRELVTDVRTREQSKGLFREKGSTIVIAGSGMLNGGRVLHHLEKRLGDERNTILLVGYQAAGTRGRLLLGGVAELKLHGAYFPVKAHIEEISTLSSHADQPELLGWMRGFVNKPGRVFIVHGEPQSADALRVRMKDVLGWDAEVARASQIVELG
jgi:metallo-beta-lactamase family protein